MDKTPIIIITILLTVLCIFGVLIHFDIKKSDSWNDKCHVAGGIPFSTRDEKRVCIKSNAIIVINSKQPS